MEGNSFAFALTMVLVGMGTVVLLKYVSFPVLTRLVGRQSAECKLIPFPLDHPHLPTEVAQRFQTVIDQLRPAGFEPVTGLAHFDNVQEVGLIVLLLADRRAKDVAMAVVSYGYTSETSPAERKAKPVTTWLLGFSVVIVSYFRYGPRLTTHNSNQFVTGTPLHAIHRFPDVKDAGRLYRLHQALAARSGMHDKVFRLDEEFHGDAAAAVAAFILEGYADDVDLGYLYLSAAEKLYRPTWKGAFLTRWEAMWPMEGIRWAAADRKARRLQAELEAEGVGHSASGGVEVAHPRQLADGEYAMRGYPTLVAVLAKGSLVLVVGGIWVQMVSRMQGLHASVIWMIVSVLCGVVLGIMMLAMTRRVPRYSPEKEAVQWRVNECEGRSVDALFASLQASTPGPAAQPATDAPAAQLPRTVARRRQSSWNRARPVAVAPGERLRVRLRAGPEMNLSNMLPRLLKPVGCLSLIVFWAIAAVAVCFLGTSAGFAVAVAGIAVAGMAAATVCLFLRIVRRLSRVAVEVSDHPLQAGRSHDLEIWHADPRTLRDVRLSLVSVEKSGQGKSARTKVSRCPPVLLASPAHSGGIWKGQLEIPRTAVSFGLGRDHDDLDDDEDLDDQVRWHLELCPRRLRPWVVRYPLEIRGPAGDSRDGPSTQPDTAQHPTRLQWEDLALWIDGDQAILAPGAFLTGGFEPHAQERHSRLRRVELSVVFVTASSARARGMLDVCHFEEYEAADDDDASLLVPRRFRAILPEGPPTFSGQLFQVAWAVRVRLYYRDEKDSVRDLPFLLLPGGGEKAIGSPAEVAGFPK
jgi:hypothetical protein